MNLRDIAASEKFREDLAIILADPTLKIALQALSEENMPSFAVRVIPGMDAMQAVALDYAQRCGAQAVITRLKKLPYISNQRLAAAEKVGKPWEYFEAPQETITSKPAPKKPRKATTA